MFEDELPTSCDAARATGCAGAAPDATRHEEADGQLNRNSKDGTKAQGGAAPAIEVNEIDLTKCSGVLGGCSSSSPSESRERLLSQFAAVGGCTVADLVGAMLPSAIGVVDE